MMENQINNYQAENHPLELLQKSGLLEIVPYDKPIELKDTGCFEQLKLTDSQKIHVGGLVQSIPAAMATAGMAQAYTVRFPKGLPRVLMELGQGGVGSMILGPDGKIAGDASFYAMTSQAAMLGTFTALSVVTGQYFLKQINDKMDTMNQKLDDILRFLEKDKKAELLSELSFVKYAYENYGSIMAHSEQRIATISSLQGAKKVAMKDIEFYVMRLDDNVPTNNIVEKVTGSGAMKKFERMCKDENSLKLSQQLYVMSSIMEAYFSQNQDSRYLGFVETDICGYIEKCKDRIIEDFSKLQGVVKGDDEKAIESEKSSLKKWEERLTQAAHGALLSVNKERTICLSNDGNVYIEKWAL